MLLFDFWYIIGEHEEEQHSEESDIDEDEPELSMSENEEDEESVSSTSLYTTTELQKIGSTLHHPSTFQKTEN